MIRGSIQEIFGSVAIGLIFTIYLIYFLYNILVIFDTKTERNGFRNWFLKETMKINSQSTTSLVIFLVSVFAMGQLIEDITDHITDTVKPKVYLPNVAASILTSEDTHRINTLIEFGDLKNKTKTTHLGEVIFKDKEFIEGIAKNINHSVNLNKLTTNPDDYLKDFNREKISDAKLDKIINSIYYRAKNWCYSQSTYFYELELIQRRINFSRSTCLVSIFLICLTLLLVIIQIANYYKLKDKNKDDDDEKEKTNLSIKQLRFKRYNIIKSVCSILFIMFLFFTSRTAYKITEENFNERAFGYYKSHLEEAKFQDNNKENNQILEMKNTLDSILLILKK